MVAVWMLGGSLEGVCGGARGVGRLDFRGEGGGGGCLMHS